jgi:AmmeMemoRadiSam system protein B
MSDLRPMSVAGTWYPAAADDLEYEVERCLSGVSIADVPPPLAIVAPHAGLKYSGPVAAFAYKAASAKPYRAAVLVGPSHFVGFNGVSIWPRGAWQTPLGPVQVAEDLATRIVETTSEVAEHRDAHGREHSLEMQLPFIAHVLPGVPIVPMVMGFQSRETAFALGDAIASACAKAKADTRADSVLLVASSDLSHFQDARTAAKMDSVVLHHVEQLDADGLMQALEKEPHHACGGGPIVSVLRAAAQLGADHARVLKYGDSGDVSGDKQSVVGYMAAAIW